MTLGDGVICGVMCGKIREGLGGQKNLSSWRRGNYNFLRVLNARECEYMTHLLLPVLSRARECSLARSAFWHASVSRVSCERLARFVTFLMSGTVHTGHTGVIIYTIAKYNSIK